MSALDNRGQIIDRLVTVQIRQKTPARQSAAAGSFVLGASHVRCLMIRADAEPIAHVSPYKRIEIGAQPKQPEPKYVEGAHWDAFWRAMSPVAPIV